MTVEAGVLMLTAFSVGFLHTLLGPDHYVPFVAMARSNRWSPRTTLLVTSLCGVGHVLSSIVIGIVGIFLGTTLFRINAIEAFRGSIAAWMLIAFGLAYFVWGIVKAIRNVPHTHLHAHADGTIHVHRHTHDTEHVHLHQGVATHEQAPAGHAPHRSETDAEDRANAQAVLSTDHAVETGGAGHADIASGTGRRTVTPWLLFLIFVFGPCEALIPLMMYPAVQANGWVLVGVVGSFFIATVVTMSVLVMLMVYGFKQIRAPHWERYGHALAGLVILVCGILVKFGL